MFYDISNVHWLFLSAQCPIFCLLKITTWFSLREESLWAFCPCGLGGTNQLTSYTHSFSRVVRWSRPGEAAYCICLTTLISSEIGDAIYVSPIRVTPRVQKDHSCHLIGVRMCKTKPPGVTVCPVMKTTETKSEDLEGEDQSIDYVILDPGSSHTWQNFQPLDFLINLSFGLGHISCLAIAFNQQNSFNEILLAHFLKSFCILWLIGLHHCHNWLIAPKNC